MNEGFIIFCWADRSIRAVLGGKAAWEARQVLCFTDGDFNLPRGCGGIDAPSS